jgi:radical SAM superfamily enzyme YgiQ (UPF0313 family)
MRFDPMRDPPSLPQPTTAAPRPGTVLLVNPFYPKDPAGSFGKHVLTPSLALPSLAAATPSSWDVRFWDENLLEGPAPVDPVPEVVGITVHLTFARRAYALASVYREHGSKVILGGPHALACADEMALHADAVAVGNGVSVWPRILEDVRAGTLKTRYEGAYGGFASEPAPRHDLVPAWAFLTRASVIATRGCHNRCDFCFLQTGEHRMRCEMRDVDDVAREIALEPSPYAVFVDNNLGANKAYLSSLCRALEPIGKIWSAAVSLDVTDDPGLVRDMALAGCTGVFVGFESLDDGSLARAGKRTPRACDYARRVELFHANGIQVNGSFVLGFDADGKDVFERTLAWVEAARLECATYHILTPYPGTPLFRRLDAEGRLLHRDFSLYDTAHAVFSPAKMSPCELEAGYRWLYARTFSLSSIVKRRPEGAAAGAAYLAMSLLYKRSNRLWRQLIQHRLTHAAWSPLVELSRRRHVAFRARLAGSSERLGAAPRSGVPPLPAGV